MSVHLSRGNVFVISLFFVFSTLAQAPPVNWAKQMQGSWTTHPTAMTNDPDGNLYTACSFAQKMSVGTQTLYGGSYVSFAVIKSDPDGKVLWGRVVSLGMGHYAASMACDAQGNVYVGGAFAGPSVFVGKTVYSAGGYDAYLMKLDAAGTLQWVKSMGGTLSDGIAGIAISATGELYAAGSFEGNALFDPIDLQSAGASDAFVARFDPSDGSLNWITQLGDINDDFASALAVDASGQVYVAGTFSIHTAIGPGSFNAYGGRDSFIAALETQAGSPQWAEQVGGKHDDIIASMVTDSQGEVYSTGVFGDTLAYGGTTLAAHGFNNIFLVKNAGSSGNPLFVKHFGGKGNFQEPHALSRGTADQIYLTGHFDNTLTVGASTFVSAGDVDVFLCELDGQGVVQWADQKGGISSDVGYTLSNDAYGNLYTGGRFSETVHYGPDQLELPGIAGGFIARWGDYAVPDKTALNKYNAKVELAVFPNPFKDQVSLNSLCSGVVQIHDVCGRVVFEQQLQNAATLTLRDLAPGVYYLTLRETNGANHVARLIKE